MAVDFKGILTVTAFYLAEKIIQIQSDFGRQILLLAFDECVPTARITLY
jgi:queuine/archaeosine tRNA-ribosyltransferase